MAVEIEKLIAETLSGLPPDHPDRRFLEGQAGVFASFNAKGEIRKKEQQESNPDYLRTVEALEKAGLTVFTIEPKSLGQMAVDKDDKGYFAHINPSETLRKLVPEVVEVAIDTQQARIKDSNDKDQNQQKAMIEKWGEELKQKTGLTDKDISVRMPHASEASQLDIAYQKANQGKKLYPDFWVRTLDETVGPGIASVGRARPGDRLSVSGRGWDAAYGSPHVWASPVVVILHRN